MKVDGEKYFLRLSCEKILPNGFLGDARPSRSALGTSGGSPHQRGGAYELFEAAEV